MVELQLEQGIRSQARYTGRPGALMRSTLPLLLAASIAVGGFCSQSAWATAIGTTATWYFDLPSTSVNSQSPPYPVVASLLLAQTADGVQFTLSPTWTDPPAGRFGVTSTIDQVNYVYKNDPANHPGGLTDFTPTYTNPQTLGNNSFRYDSGAPVKDFIYNSNPNNSIDSSYKDQDQNLIIDFFTGPQAPNRFNSNFANSVWTVLNTDLSNFTSTYATSNSHPSPAQGVISVSSYSLENPKPTPSNWVTGPCPTCGPGTQSTPEPATMALVGVALAAIAVTRRRKGSSSRGFEHGSLRPA